MKKKIWFKKKLKGYHEVNLLMRWGIVFSILIALFTAYFVENISFNLIHGTDAFEPTNLFGRMIYLFDIKYDLDTKMLAIILALIIIYWVENIFASHVNRRYLARFIRVKELGTYIEAFEKIYFTEKKYDHVVLILHGYSGSAQEFEYLIEYFKKNKINYYVPNVLGFGLDRLSLLNHVKRRDWYRISLNHFDYLSSIANKVSVIGQSMGGLLASYIAANRKVYNLILTSPAFYPSKSNIKYKKILTDKILARLYIMFVPFSPKPINKEYGYLGSSMDPDVAKKVFHYLTIPVRSVRELFIMQNEVRMDKMQFHKLYLLYGKFEKTIDIEKAQQALDGIGYDYEQCCFLNSGHNVLLDYDRDFVCQYIVDAVAI